MFGKESFPNLNIVKQFVMSYLIKNGNLTYSEFVDSIGKINRATSITGIVYSNIQIINDKVVGIRESTNKPFDISLKKLYDAYCNVLVFTTAELKSYVDRVQSPSLAILIAIKAVSPMDNGTDLAVHQPGEIITVKESFYERNKWLIKFSLTFIIVGAIILFGKLNSEKTIENGKLTSTGQVEAIMAIKSQLNDPSSYEGSGDWQEAIWDSSSQIKRYVVKHTFTYKNSWGQRVRSIAFIYFDVNGKPTDIEFMDMNLK